MALCCASFAQEAKVTYTTGAVSAKKAIAELAQKSGAKIACSAAMANEVLILRLQDAPMDQVMAQIAAVTSGTWTKEGDTSYLVANGGGRTAEANRALQHFAAKIGTALKKQQETLAKRGPSSADQGSAMFAAMGAGEASMVKLALAIGVNQLAAVPDGGRVVYSSNPTRMQRPLPGGADAIVAEFVTEYNKRAAIAKQDEPAKTAADEQMSALMELFGNRMRKPKPITSPPAKALVIATRRGMFFGFTLELKLYDASGTILATTSSPVVTDMPFDPQALIRPTAPPKSEGQEIQLSALSKELYSANRSFGAMSAGNVKFSKELMDALKDPVERDPPLLHSLRCSDRDRAAAQGAASRRFTGQRNLLLRQSCGQGKANGPQLSQRYQGRGQGGDPGSKRLADRFAREPGEV